jgi:parvulin-like peptidyl-prolyl isomerase
MRSIVGRLLRDPLLHFLLAGAAVFAAYAWLHPESIARDASHRIELTQDDLRQIAVGWIAQGRPTPTPDEMHGLVESRVREELLYREALALGLDQGDTIVKRRLAQKMEFLFEDLSALREPTNAELESWFAEHTTHFALPARATFRLLYFSPDRRGDRARDDATHALAQLASAPGNTSAAAALADPFMFQDYYGDHSFGDVAKSFGPGFAEALFQLEPGAWHGPIESGYGWHLVFVDSKTPSSTPAFEEVEADVRSAWIAAQREAIRERALGDLKARYEIVVPEDLAVSSPVASEGAQVMAAP